MKLLEHHLSPFTRGLLTLLLFFFLVGGVLYFRQDLTLQRQGWNKDVKDLFYLPSRKNLARMSLGHKTLLADLIWTRTLLYAGNHFLRRSTIHWIPRYIDSITTLDPKFRKPYLWGSVIMLYNRIGTNRAHALKSIALLKRGRAQFPNDYEFPYQLALNYLYEIKFNRRTWKQLQADHKLFCESDFFRRPASELDVFQEQRVNPIKLWEARMRHRRKPSKRWMALFRKTKACMRQEATSLLLEASSKPNAPARFARLAQALLRRNGKSDLVICQHLQELLWQADSQQVREQLRSQMKQHCSKDVLKEMYCRELQFTKQWQKQMPYISRQLYQLIELPGIYQSNTPLQHPLPAQKQSCDQFAAMR